MKTRNKALLIAVSAVLIVIATTFGTLAYLTSEITVTHTFTVGDVEVNLNVTQSALMSVDGESVQGGETQKLMPNHDYMIPVSVALGEESEEAWVFIQVINPFKPIEAAEGSKMFDGTGYEEPYTLLDNQIVDNGWLHLDGCDNVYYFASKAKAGDILPVYSYFKVSNEAMGGTAAEAIAEMQAEVTAAEGETETEEITLTDAQRALYLGEYDGKSMVIIAYVVQADGIADVNAAWSVFEAQYQKNVEKYYPAETTATVSEDLNGVENS